jgi:4a-hydroxytetrahydrobiopterin dehydratase
MPLLDGSVVTAFLADHPDWSVVDGELTRTFTFRDFSESMRFVNRVAEAAESASHHPDITIKWNRVTLTLSTHSEGGLTGKDLALATTVESL